MNRYEEKADCVVAAHVARFGGVIPSKHAVVAICAVAEHETSCGDAWNHSGNWGAILRRPMTDAEKEVAATGQRPEPTDAFEEIHGDSSPVKGKYKTWFWRFPDGIVYPRAGLAGDQAGAWLLIYELLVHRKSIQPLVDQISMEQLALLMYRSGYFEGFHDPRGEPGADGLTDGQRANVADYAHALFGTAGAFTAGLRDWWPESGGYPVEGVERPFDGPEYSGAALVYGAQFTLNELSRRGLWPLLIPLRQDGVKGPKTIAELKRWQGAHGLDVTGDLDAKTTAALLEDVA